MCTTKNKNKNKKKKQNKKTVRLSDGESFRKLFWENSAESRKIRNTVIRGACSILDGRGRARDSDVGSVVGATAAHLVEQLACRTVATPHDRADVAAAAAL